MVRQHLGGKVPVSDLVDEHQIQLNRTYRRGHAVSSSRKPSRDNNTGPPRKLCPDDKAGITKMPSHFH